MRIAVFTDVVDDNVKLMWNRLNLALILHCLPSEIDTEAARDIQGIRIILSARAEKQEEENK